jgi:hypothetical protein
MIPLPRGGDNIEGADPLSEMGKDPLGREMGCNQRHRSDHEVFSLSAVEPEPVDHFWNWSQFPKGVVAEGVTAIAE